MCYCRASNQGHARQWRWTRQQRQLLTSILVEISERCRDAFQYECQKTSDKELVILVSIYRMRLKQQFNSSAVGLLHN